MIEDVVIEPMSEQFILWRCLHGGPLSRQTIDQWPPDDSMPWPKFRARNVPLLRKLIEAYGTCALVARDGDEVVGTLRFYPKALFSTARGAMFCLQQDWPAGAAEEIAAADLPPPPELEDRTLVVHCIMTGSPSQKHNPYQRKGIGQRLVRALASWAAQRGWEAIEVTTHEDLDVLYAITGSAGKGFWAKLGFRLIKAEPEPAFEEAGDLLRTMREEADARGLDPAVVTNRYLMRLDLTRGPAAGGSEEGR